MSNLAVVQPQQSGLIENLAQSANLNPAEFKSTLMATVMPGNITNEQFTAFLMVAEKYDLNPITKEIYAFPARGGIQPIVSIDGWIKLINSNPQFDGMEFKDSIENGNLLAVTCKIFRKDRSHPIEVTEYLSECFMDKSPAWSKFPARMLRHKATIQAARYAFGFSGIYDPDEGERIAASQNEPEITATIEPEIIMYPQELFDKNIDNWLVAIKSGKKTADDIINKISTKGNLTVEQKAKITGEK